jgi:hypothetical protein
MAAIARLAAVSLDGADPAALATFYRELLGLDVMFESDDFIALQGAGIFVTTQRVEHHQPPTWPDEGVPKQMHLELAVTDLDDAEAKAIAIGAVKPAEQPNPELWRVLADPDGHVFCLTTLIPEG